jgi:hypothetical protein
MKFKFRSLAKLIAFEAMYIENCQWYLNRGLNPWDRITWVLGLSASLSEFLKLNQ